MEGKVEQFTSYLLKGDEASCEMLIEGLPDKDDIFIVFQLLTRSMQRIGELWENNEISVADEHLATATCDFILSQYKYRYISKKKTKKNEKKAMFFCLENEQHYLGTKMIASLFEYKGWDVRLFGANLPLEYAQSQAEEWKPNLIGISVAIMYHLPKLKSYIDTLSQISIQPSMLVGGRLAGIYDLRPYCSEETVIMKDIKDVQDWLDQKSSEGYSNVTRKQHSSSLFSNQS